MNKKVLIVEDDRKTAELIQIYLQKDGYRVTIASDGKKALEMARRILPDLVILDLMLPQIDGMDVCRRLRAESNVPVIMLTARSTEEDKLQGLEIGADDYMTKPFSSRELMARIRAVLRRTDESDEQEAQDVIIGDISISLLR
ncbi:MAG: response regulator transcription factor, partial [Dehalococcoidia bacterium]|nr:response regulator transcription factor [Dehalococcoidia bacterium]